MKSVFGLFQKSDPAVDDYSEVNDAEEVSSVLPAEAPLLDDYDNEEEENEAFGEEDQYEAEEVSSPSAVDAPVPEDDGEEGGGRGRRGRVGGGGGGRRQ